MFRHETEADCSFRMEVRDWLAWKLDASLQDLPDRPEPAQMPA